MTAFEGENVGGGKFEGWLRVETILMDYSITRLRLVSFDRRMVRTCLAYASMRWRELAAEATAVYLWEYALCRNGRRLNPSM